MGLFDGPVREIEKFVAGKCESAGCRKLPIRDYSGWPSMDDLILKEETALELGNPKQGSLALLAWTEEHFEEDSVVLIGPDLGEIGTPAAPFAQIVLVSGSFDEGYPCFCELRDAIYDARLKGMMFRVMPSRQMIWTRINRDALDHGLSLGHLGSAFIEALSEIPFVSGVRVVFVTSGKQDLAKLSAPAARIERIVGAMIKMTEEMRYDCEGCEYRDVCSEVAELKRMRNRLKEEKES
jgi:CO dehydrogenase/acetyl-CoA synthase beta subunit